MIQDLSALWRDDVTEDEVDETYQSLIDSGLAWRLEGSVGREAMARIEDGRCILGESGHCDYWGNYVPSRHEVVPGSKGSAAYAEARRADD